MNDRHSFIFHKGKILAIIVDRAQKRANIALSSREILLQKGIKKLTVAEVAKIAKVAKGSIYDYFENKEDIVFEVIRTEISQYQMEIDKQIEKSFSTKLKVIKLFSFLLEDNELNKKHQNLYKEYMSINLSGKNEMMSKFNTECGDFFKDILLGYIKEGIEKKELKEESIGLVEGLIALEKGFLIISWTEQKDIRKDFLRFLDTLFDLIEI